MIRVVQWATRRMTSLGQLLSSLALKRLGSGRSLSLKCRKVRFLSVSILFVSDCVAGPAEADDIFFNGKDDAFLPDDPPDSDSDDSQGGKRPQVRYVYDAAAERTEQRLREGQAQQLVNGT